ncbi:MAG: VOC family protein [Acidobacteriota bacterium]
MGQNALISRVGGVISADIAVPEHDREVGFYSRVLTTGEQPLWRPDLMNNQGQPIIGLGERTPEYADLPLQWMPHIQVKDVAESVRRALELGGTELMHGKNSDGESLWAGLADPGGAGFGIIPVVPPEAITPPDGGAPADAPVGTIAWLDLTVPDADPIRDFYRHVVGWSVENVEMKDGDEAYADYQMMGGDGQAAAGVCHARGMNLGLPPTWLLYLPVGDLAESLRRVKDEGGTVLKEARGADGKIAYAAVQDPVGVSFALVPG